MERSAFAVPHIERGTSSSLRSRAYSAPEWDWRTPERDCLILWRIRPGYSQSASQKIPESTRHYGLERGDWGEVMIGDEIFWLHLCRSWNSLGGITTNTDYGFVAKTSWARCQLGQVHYLPFELVVSTKHESSWFVCEGMHLGELFP